VSQPFTTIPLHEFQGATSSRVALSIVIPAYNESPRLPQTLNALIDFLARDGRKSEVIVVDDGSTDDTSAKVRELETLHRNVKLIRLPQNRGKGYAVRTGVVNASGAVVLFADADGATPFEELYRLEAQLVAGARIAIGSRGLRSRQTRVEARFYRRVLGRAFHTVVRAFAIRGIADTQCGFKLFDAEVAHDLFSRMRMTGYSFDVEVLLMALRSGYRVAEVPVNWTHQAGSKVHVIRDGLVMVRDVLRIRANALRGLYRKPHIALGMTPVSVSIVGEGTQSASVR
jgi:dolichyl-phosphate beta-glucosyltransferase